MVTALNRLANLIGISEGQLRREVLPPHLRAEEDHRERSETEKARAALIADSAAIVKRAEQQTPAILKRTAAAKAEAAEKASRLAQAEYSAAFADQQSESFRTSAAIGRNEIELRKLAPECIAAGLRRVGDEETALRRSGVRSWEEDKGPEYRERFAKHHNLAKVNARFAALREAREAIHVLPLRCTTDVQMEAEIASIFENLPAIE